jgi:hypothetical protein
MSSPITPLQSPLGEHSSNASSIAPARAGGSFSTELAASERASAVEVLRAGPPPEVIAQMASAAGVHEQLQREGRELRFLLPETHGRVRIELFDADLGAASTISGAEALEIAAGKQ